MSLSCSCGDDYDWWYEPPVDFERLATKRGRVCASCKERIAVGALVLAMRCWKHPGYGNVQEKIYGEGGEVPLPTRHLCEQCGDLYLSLDELGFCITLGDDMRELVREYAETYGPKAALAAEEKKA